MYLIPDIMVEKDSPEQLSALPFKKKRNRDLLKEEEKEYHKIKKRIVIEHTICRLKKYRIMNDVFRNKLRKYNKMLCCMIIKIHEFTICFI